MYVCVFVCVFVCVCDLFRASLREHDRKFHRLYVCVCERQRVKKREERANERASDKARGFTHSHMHVGESLSASCTLSESSGMQCDAV